MKVLRFGEEESLVISISRFRKSFPNLKSLLNTGEEILIAGSIRNQLDSDIPRVPLPRVQTYGQPGLLGGGKCIAGCNGWFQCDGNLFRFWPGEGPASEAKPHAQKRQLRGIEGNDDSLLMFLPVEPA